MYCMSFTRLPYFHSLGAPCSLGLLVVLLASLTLGRAMVVVANRFGVFDPKRAHRERGWRAHDMVGKTKEMQADTSELRDHLADFDDFWRPIRSYFYWERHCFDIPICWSLRSIFDGLDGLDKLTDDLGNLMKDLDQLDTLMPQLLVQLPPMIATMKTLRGLMLTMQSTFSGLINQMDAFSQNATAMRQAFDAAKNDDSFYLPPEAFQNPDFIQGLKLFLSPDGISAQHIITHKGDPATPEGISHIDRIMQAASEAVKGTP